MAAPNGSNHDEAPPTVEHPDGDVRHTSEDDDEDQDAEVFADYVPQLITIGRDHPSDVKESASLAGVVPPDASLQHELRIAKRPGFERALSKLQLESIVYAMKRHGQFGGGASVAQRSGFLIGDGAGVGKGRTIAGLVLENWLRGRRKHVWITENDALYQDAERDLSDVGAHVGGWDTGAALFSVKETTPGAEPPAGVAFLSYYTLVRDEHFKRLLEWCGRDFDGVIAFDESHKAKNLHSEDAEGSERNASKTARCVAELQKVLPRARVVYVSATGACEPQNMAYMTRLHLWGLRAGPGAAANFKTFRGSLERGGIGAMEAVSIDLKARGVMVARSLSFAGTSCTEDVVDIGPAGAEMYDGLARVLRRLRRVCVDGPAGSRRNAVGFRGAQQAVFRAVCVGLKVDRALEIAREALRANQCVVIGLQGTGAASTGKTAAENEDEGGVQDFTSAPQQRLLTYIADMEHKLASGPGDESQRAEAVKELRALYDEVSEMSLPPNPIDKLVIELGGPDRVADLTGRAGRIERTADGRLGYVPRKFDAAARNVERQAFQDGKKLVAIISAASSTGVSLHADRRASNKRRRVHITIELPWAADQAVQQFGRTHRANQVLPPVYCLLMTNIGGERRFLSSVAMRMQKLGALMSGDRRAADSQSLGKYNAETEIGQLALKDIMTAIDRGSRTRGGNTGGRRPPIDAVEPRECREGRMTEAQFLQRCREIVDDMGMTKPGANGAAASIDVSFDNQGVRKFLSHLLGANVADQEMLLAFYDDQVLERTRQARASGKLDRSAQELRGTGVWLARHPEVLYRDPASGAETLLNRVMVDTRLPFGAAEEFLRAALEEEERVRREDAQGSSPKSGFYLTSSRKKQTGVAVAAYRKRGGRVTYEVREPGDCKTRTMRRKDFEDKFRTHSPLEDPVQIEGLWEEQYARSEVCHEHVVLSGVLLPIIGALASSSASICITHCALTRAHACEGGEAGKPGQRIVGIPIEGEIVDDVRAKLEELAAQAMELYQQQQRQLPEEEDTVVAEEAGGDAEALDSTGSGAPSHPARSIPNDDTDSAKSSEGGPSLREQVALLRAQCQALQRRCDAAEAAREREVGALREENAELRAQFAHMEGHFASRLDELLRLVTQAGA
ncbi:unnamed protein product [Pedinophyceae sp. YPF-701]|nr:unnamed protein product [Pedinophyceae sp. YPF-701]